MKRLLVLAFVIGLMGNAVSFAQRDNTEEKKENVKLKVSGYMQGTIVFGEKYAKSSIGTNTDEKDNPFVRMGLRRGYVRLDASYKSFTAQTEVRATDKLLGIYHAYLKYTPKRLPHHSFTFGLATVPFGYELGVSSRSRETFERAAYFGDLFPSDVDMGLFYKYKRDDTRFYINSVAFDLGATAGNSTYGMRKAFPDAVMRFVFGHKGKRFSHMYGYSAYYGYATALGKQRARRLYMGGYIDYTLHLNAGDLKLRGETIGGWQAGTAKSNSAIGKNSPEKLGAEKYLLVERPFIGAMGMLVFRMKKLPLEGFVKYDYYDRNLKLDERLEDAKARQTLRYEAEGISHKGTFGINAYFLDERVRLSAHYELNKVKMGYYDNPFADNPTLDTFWSTHDDTFLLGVQFRF